MWYSTLEFVVLLQSTYISTLILEVCFYKCHQTPKSPSLKQSPCHHQYEQKNKIQTPQVSNGLFLFIMSCKPKNYVIYLFP